MKNRILACLLILVIAFTGCVSNNAQSDVNRTVKTGDKIQVHYNGTLHDGTLFDSSQGRSPLEFTVGSGQVIKGFDNGVIGMKVGETKSLFIPAANAYGEHDPTLIINVSSSAFGNNSVPQIGQTVYSAQGASAVVIANYTDGNVTLDVNNPLAGKDLHFDIQLIKIY